MADAAPAPEVHAMLVELTIRDFALIDELSLAMGSGLNAITGATGSGKSLLVTALEVLAGGRPRGGPREWVREGAKRASVEGRFAFANAASAARVSEWLAEHLPEVLEDWEEGGERELVLARTLGADGRSRCSVDNRAVAQRALAELAALLFEIHGQNDDQLLFEPDEQLRLLDATGELEAEVAAYARARGEWRRAAEELAGLEATRRERRNLLADLRFQSSELGESGIAAGEREALVAERGLLRNAEELARELGGWVQSLSEGDDAALDRLRGAERALERWREVRALEGPAGELREALAHLEEACASIVSFASGLEADPARLEEVEARLAELDRLERKYGEDEAGLLRLAGELGGRIAELEGAEESVAGLAQRVAAHGVELERRAGALTRARKKLGPRLGRAVQGALAELGMPAARFEVALAARKSAVARAAAEIPGRSGADGGGEAPGRMGEGEARENSGGVDLERFGPRGADAVEFLLGANPGEPSKPLRHVASGGEAARVMLALRSVFSRAAAEASAESTSGARTLVFDEIDSGVGGHLAPVVALHLRALARGDQVLCVTHLPAIAAAADRHLKVAKEVAAGRSRTAVEELEGERRVREVADMIGGGSSHETARAEARRLLEAQR